MASFYPFDLVCFALKIIFIPILVFTMAVYEGNQLKEASFEVPIVTLQSVMKAYMVCVVMFIGISILFYAKEGVSF